MNKDKPSPEQLIKAVEAVLPSDLESELKRGADAFAAVAQHMANMGADGTISDETVLSPRGGLLMYRVSVEFLGESPLDAGLSWAGNPGSHSN